MRTHRTLLTSVAALALLASCHGGLPAALRREVSLESERVREAERQVNKSQSALERDLAEAPQLFQGASEAVVWKARLGEAKTDLEGSDKDGRELARLVARDRPDSNISRLLTDERRLRSAALQKAESVDRAVAKWMNYQRDPAGFAATINGEREAVRTFDLNPVTKSVQKAEQDWPEKKPVLETRLAALISSSKTSEPAVQLTPSVLIAEEETLSQQADSLARDSQKLQSECGQLYDAWDKILTDLDQSHSGRDALFRERVKTVRTHFIDVPSKKTETGSDERWTDVSEASFHEMQNEIGMCIAHKDAGQFDSEAQHTPQPPGFSYVAPPSVGSNQYGYWTHSGGESVWAFLPQYLLLRELLWNRDYRPVLPNEYNAYRVAQSRGATYYGRETPTAAPKYGTHGTFTQQHYANSRYVQSGGFKGSAYASSGNGNAGSSLRNGLSRTPQSPATDGAAGKRFGRQPSSEPLGQRFGHAPSSRPAGRSFGRRR